MEKQAKSIHLFNCEKTFNLDSVESLFTSVASKLEFDLSIEKHHFTLSEMSEMSNSTIPGLKMDFAFFVVHAHESPLSINEDNAGISYAEIYRALLQATEDNVVIIIGGDDNYIDEDEENKVVLSRWARKKISSQFDGEYLDGRKSFVFSWNEKHREIHEEAVLHYFDQNKKGEKFEPKPKEIPSTQANNQDAKGMPEMVKVEVVNEQENVPSDTQDSVAIDKVDQDSEGGTGGAEVSGDVSQGSTSSKTAKLETYLRYGKISFESKDIVIWDGIWRPSEEEEKRLENEWKARRIAKLTIYVDENGEIREADVKSLTVRDYCSIS